MADEIQETIRVMIVDDHAVVRSGLAAFLFVHNDLELVTEAADGDEALQLVRQFNPDVILLDLVMPGTDGMAVLGQIRQHYPQIQVIVLTSFPDEGMVNKAIEAGAISYLLKSTTASELADAIRAAYHGQSTLSPEATQALIHRATSKPEVGHDLTPREREVLKLLVQGLNNSQIAETLTISLSTVQFHVSSILAKLHVTNRVQAATVALQHHLVEQDS